MITLRYIASVVLLGVSSLTWAQTVGIAMSKKAGNREQFAAQYLQKKLSALGYQSVVGKKGDYRIDLSIAKDTAGLKHLACSCWNTGTGWKAFT